MPTAEDFRHELFRILEAAKNSGSEFVEINAGALHRRLGGYPGIDSRMPDCCEVMKAQLRAPCKVGEVNRPPEIGLNEELYAAQCRRREPSAKVRLPGG